MDRKQRSFRRAAGVVGPLLGAGLVLPAWLVKAEAGARSQPTSPVTTYVMEAVTSSGLGAMAMGTDILRMMMGGPASMNSASRRLELQLRSPGKAASPTAEHRIPPTMAMGTALPLSSASDGPAPPGLGQEMDVAEPKGRLLIYRGCAETAGAGQPEIISLQGLLPDQRRLALAGLKGLATGPGVGGAPHTHGHWPSGDAPAAVPPQASLVGSHVVASNYAPEIRFQVERRHDFLAPVTLTSTAAGGAQRLSWQSIPNALGYQAMATGVGRQEGDVVMWTSSETAWADSSVPGDLQAAAAARLVQRGVLLPPERTSCTVSAQAMASMRTAMLSFTAYGDTLVLNSAKDAPAWRLRLERRSTTLRPLGEGMEGLVPGSGEGTQAPAPEGGGFNLFKLF